MINYRILVSIALVLTHGYSFSEETTPLIELQTQLYEKNLELSTLGKKIEAQNAVIESYKQKFVELCKKNCSEDSNQFNQLMAESETFFEELAASLKDNSQKKFLAKKLISDEFDTFDHINFVLLRIMTELEILENVIDEYEICLREAFFLGERYEELTH